jgi:hypothetical protein
MYSINSVWPILVCKVGIVFHHVESSLVCHLVSSCYFTMPCGPIFWWHWMVYKDTPNLKIHSFETFCSSWLLRQKWVQLFQNTWLAVEKSLWVTFLNCSPPRILSTVTTLDETRFFITLMAGAAMPSFGLKVQPWRSCQGCQMVYFQTKNSNFVTFWRALEWKMLVHFIYAHLEYIAAIWYIVWIFGNLVVI